MADERLDSDEIIGRVLSQLELDGVSFESKGYDFYTDSYRIAFKGNNKTIVLSFPTEKMVELNQDKPFTARRLKKQLIQVLGLDAVDGD